VVFYSSVHRQQRDAVRRGERHSIGPSISLYFHNPNILVNARKRYLRWSCCHAHVFVDVTDSVKPSPPLLLLPVRSKRKITKSRGRVSDPLYLV
jgi:hypothetical protein